MNKTQPAGGFPVTMLGVALSISILLNIVLISRVYSGLRVAVVFDGDSFELENGTRVRLLGVDAPEKGRCMADESKAVLSSLILGKHVRITHGVMDSFGRLIGTVYVVRFPFRDINVGGILADRGLVKNNSVASQKAKSNKLGIYSDRCIGEEHPPGCDIKGNIRKGIKQYYLPSCQAYDQVIVDQSYGDQWVCSESEAQREGYSRAPSCN